LFLARRAKPAPATEAVREPALSATPRGPRRRAPDADYWLRPDTLVEPTSHAAHRLAVPEPEPEQAPEPATRSGVLWIGVILMLCAPAMVAWDIWRPVIQPRIAPLLQWRTSAVPPPEPPVETLPRIAVVEVPPAAPEAPMPPPVAPVRGSDSPERIAAAQAVPRTVRCAVLIRAVQAGTALEVTDLAYLQRRCAPD
jgi:hypothetical protein